MSIITLCTDFGVKDPYLGVVKGQIYKLYPQAVIVDLTHEIEKFNLLQAAFVLRNSFLHFPEGSIHLISVDSEASDKFHHVAVHYKGHYFIGNDNGIFSLIMDEFPEEVVVLNKEKLGYFPSFPARDILSRAAASLASGQTLSSLGEKSNSLLQKHAGKPAYKEDRITGQVIYADSYGNLISNISRERFLQMQQNRKFNISFRNLHRNIDRDGYELSVIREKYNDVPFNELVAIFNGFGLLEIAINKGNAYRLLGIAIDDTLLIDFYD